MNYAIVLSGGTGTRLGGQIPKQYLLVNGKPIFLYSLKALQDSELVHKIIIVASEEWQGFILDYVEKHKITKFQDFASSGISRQHSVLNGLNCIYNNFEIKDVDGVIIHDAARPNVEVKLINSCLQYLNEYDGAMPVIKVNDTIYYSETGEQIDNLLNRDKLFAGQSPEAFNLKKYYNINAKLTDDKLSAIRGSSQIAYEHGFKIRLFDGDINNYKITTIQDLDKFKTNLGAKENESIRTS